MSATAFRARALPRAGSHLGGPIGHAAQRMRPARRISSSRCIRARNQGLRKIEDLTPNSPGNRGVRIRRQRGYVCEPAKARQKSAKPPRKSAHRLIHVLAADRGLDRNPAAGRADCRCRGLLCGVAAGLHERLLLHRHAQHLRWGAVRARRFSRGVCRVRRRGSLDYQHRRHRRDRRGVLSHQAGGLRGWCASLPGIIGHASVD